MSEWKEYRFSEFVDINPAVKLPKDKLLSFVEMKDLESNKRHCMSSQNRLLSGGSKFENGDTLFARITPCLENGKICQVKGLKNGKGFGSTEFHVFRGKRGISESDFVYYLSRWDDVRDHAEINLDGTSGRQRVPKQAFDDLILLLPPLPEQLAISSVLSSLDDKIDLLYRQNTILEKMAETLFRQWFVEDAKDEWEKVELGSVVQTYSGGTPPRTKIEYYKNGTIHWVKSKELNGRFIFETEEKITKDALKNSSAKILPANSILIAMYGATVGEYAIISEDMACNQAVCALKPNKNYPYTYLFLLIKQNKQELINMAVGSAQQNISQLLIKQLPVLNCRERIKIFHNIVEPLFNKIRYNQQQIHTLTSLRNRLLPKLMSGEIRVEI